MVRVKRRYILLKLVQDQGQGVQNDFEIKNEIKSHIEKSYGDFGVGCLTRGFQTKKFDKNDGYMIIQLRKGVHEMVMSILPLITRVNEKPCGLSMIHLSGTLRSSFKELRIHYLHNLRRDIAKQLTISNSKVSV